MKKFDYVIREIKKGVEDLEREIEYNKGLKTIYQIRYHKKLVEEIERWKKLIELSKQAIKLLEK